MGKKRIKRPNGLKIQRRSLVNATKTRLRMYNTKWKAGRHGYAIPQKVCFFLVLNA